MTELSRHTLEILREDGEFVLSRGRREGDRSPLLVVAPASEHPALGSLRRLEHAYALRDALDPAWAARPVALVRHQGWLTLLLVDPGGEVLEPLLGYPLELTHFLRVAIGLAVALGRLHARGLIHKDIKPANILAHVGTGRVCRTLPGGAPGARRRVRWPPGPGAPSDQEPDGTARRSSMPCRTVSAPSCCVGSASVTYWSRGASPPHRPARTSRMQRGHAFSARP